MCHLICPCFVTRQMPSGSLSPLSRCTITFIRPQSLQPCTELQYVLPAARNRFRKSRHRRILFIIGHAYAVIDRSLCLPLRFFASRPPGGGLRMQFLVYSIARIRYVVPLAMLYLSEPATYGSILVYLYRRFAKSTLPVLGHDDSRVRYQFPDY